MSGQIKMLIIGGGVAGYPAAISAARRGAAVTLIEKDQLGGTCLNRGCIPTKALLHAGEVLHTIQTADRFGIQCAAPSVDVNALVARKNAVVDGLRRGVEALVRHKKIQRVGGTAELIDANTVRIKETGDQIGADRILIATGAMPVRLRFDGGDRPDVIDSDQVLTMEQLPKRVVIVGGGVIGVEFAQIFNRLGSDVTILELTETLIPGADVEIVQVLAEHMRERGVKVINGAQVESITGRKGRPKVQYRLGEKVQRADAEQVILAVGRRPVLEGLGIEAIGLEVANGSLKVDDKMQTNIGHIYGAGDVVGGVMLAHAAMAEGECAVHNALGEERHMRGRPIPACVYTQPEIASVGPTEAEAAAGHEIMVGRFPFKACGKAMVMDRAEGLVKIIAEKTYGEILGVHIIGPRATDMIAEAVLGMSMEMTVTELAGAIHPHPTLSETIMEAAMSLCDGPIHMP